MKTLRAAEIVTGIVLALLGLALLVAALQIPGTAEQRLRPGAAPTLLSAIAILISLFLALQGWRDRGEPHRIDWPERDGVARLVVTVIGIAAYIALLETVGFPLASLLFASALCWYLGRYPWWVALAVGVGSGAVIHYGFIRAIGLGLPLGILENIF